jgi:hypothetical protein
LTPHHQAAAQRSRFQSGEDRLTLPALSPPPDLLQALLRAGIHDFCTTTAIYTIHTLLSITMSTYCHNAIIFASGKRMRNRGKQKPKVQVPSVMIRK